MMPTTGAYEFQLAKRAVDAKVPEDHIEHIEAGEWAWVHHGDIGCILMSRCPDCDGMATLWRNGRGHNIDSEGNISPSVLHSYKIDGIEQCGFHTMPTKLRDFIDLR